VIARHEQQEQTRRARERQLALERLFGPTTREKRFDRCSFHNWQPRPGTEAAYQAARRYARHLPRHLESGQGLLLFGPPGSGKSHLAAAVSAAARDQGLTVLFQRVTALLSRLRSAYDPRPPVTESQLLSALARADLLILDDAGAEKASPWTEQTFYTIIDERYSRQRPLILTTNASLDRLAQQLGARTMDRLLEICQIVENRGESYRREQAFARLGQPPDQPPDH